MRQARLIAACAVVVLVGLGPGWLAATAIWGAQIHSMLGRIGIPLFLIGFAMVGGTFVIGTRPGHRLIVWARGSMQRREDFSESGWRWYVAGLCVAIAGFSLIVLAIIFYGEP